MEDGTFRRIGPNRYERRCPTCQGHTTVTRDFSTLRWHCLICGALSTSTMRAAAPRDCLPCGHDSMYGDRDEPLDGPCPTCGGSGTQEASYFDLVALGIFVVDEDPVIIAPSTSQGPQHPYALPQGSRKKRGNQRTRKLAAPQPIGRSPEALGLAKEVAKRLTRGQRLTHSALKTLIATVIAEHSPQGHDATWWTTEVLRSLEHHGMIDTTGHYIWVCR